MYQSGDSTQFPNPHIRWMIKRDFPEVLSIEQQCNPLYGWTEDTFLAALRQRNIIGMVAEYQETIVGFMIYELHKSKLTILNMGVHLNHRNEYIGRAMINKLKAKLSQHRRTVVDLVVRETNLGAQLFLKKMGFQATMVHRQWWEDTNEDGYAMRYVLLNIQPEETTIEQIELAYE